MENKNQIVKVESHIAKISNEELLVKYSPKNCMKHSSKVKTVEMAINSLAPTIGTLHREKSRDFTEGLIMGWLVYLNDILNLNKPMTEDQIEMCSIEVVNEYYALKMSDLTLLFKRITSGAYGEFYESMSIPKVLSFFRKYYDERLELAAQLSERSHNNIRSDETFNISKNVKRIWKGTPSK